MSDEWNNNPEGSKDEVSKEEMNNGMLGHLLSFVSWAGIPFGNILGPLIFWQVNKGKSEFADAHAKESLNFQITMSLVSVVFFVLTMSSWFGMMFSMAETRDFNVPWMSVIGIIGLLAIGLFGLINVIRASIKAYRGETFQYPFCLRLVK